MPTGHAVPFIMFYRGQPISDQIGEEAPLQRHGVERGHRISGANGGKEDIADKRNVVAKGQDKERALESLSSILQVESQDENHGEEIITDVGKGHDVRKPWDDPSLHPDGGLDSKQEEIDPHQNGVDIRMKILNQIAEGFVNQNKE